MSSSQSTAVKVYFGCSGVAPAWVDKLPLPGRRIEPPYAAVFRIESTLPLVPGGTFLAAAELSPWNVSGVMPAPPGTLPDDALAIVRFTGVPLDGLDLWSTCFRTAAARLPLPPLPWRERLARWWRNLPDPREAARLAEHDQTMGIEVARIIAEEDTFLRLFQPRWAHASEIAPIADAVCDTFFRRSS